MNILETIDLIEYAGGEENTNGDITITAVDTITSLPLQQFRDSDEYFNIQLLFDKGNTPFICDETLYFPLEYEIFRDFNEFHDEKLKLEFDYFINLCELYEVGTSVVVCYTVCLTP